MKIKTSELTGAALDWAVATVEGYTELHRMENRWDHEPHLAMHPPRREYGVVEMWQLGFSTDWAQAGPIIEREWLHITPWPNESDEDLRWQCKQHDSIDCVAFGPTPLIAAMRCFVASRLGDAVEVPEAL